MDIEAESGPDAEPIAAKTLGIFNVSLGTLLLLAVLYEAGVVLAMPLLGHFMTWAQGQQQQQVDRRWSARQAGLEEMKSKAQTQDEREFIQAELTLAELNERVGEPQWLGFSVGFLDDPAVRAGAMAKLGVMSVLNGLLIASGIGLIRLRAWGRSMARVTALLLIPATLGFAAASVPTAPGMAGRWTDELRKTMFPPVPDREVSAAIDAELEEYQNGMAQLFRAVMVAFNGGLVVYPLVVLVVASRPGVGRAVRGRAAP